MKLFLFLVVFITAPFLMKAQTDDESWRNVYRASSTKINDLVHTKLDVKFDYDKQWLYGKEWITLHPHFYPTDSLSLDAKGMDIKEIAVVKGNSKSALPYQYDGMILKISLNKLYKAEENYTIYIDYISKPNDLKVKGSSAITNAKGLYFINPKGEDKNKPTQIWTQGETEANSVWFPTIDKPNQKTTEEIYMTVPDKYVTLSNGLLISQKKNTDGTRTDYWKMDLPHSPYLFFMGVGDYAIIKDSYKGKEVSYYVEKEYAPVARKIFGETPAMISFYEKITGIPYQWPKYSQITGRDFVSGAMENTSATLHTDVVQQNARQLTDGNKYEEYVSHELFHQWFGDLVTTESWSNITLNESFADYSESLWMEYRYGKDAADEHTEEHRQIYLNNPENAKKDLVRFYYNDKEDLFDNISYEKGGSILCMLRNYVGDSAFFKALNKYLTENKFKTAEAHQLRLAFEDVTGQDLNWFWNQWYYGSGHPQLKINYSYTNGMAYVITEQTQNTGKIFRLPVAIDVYNGANKKRYNVWIENKTDTFAFTATVKPTLINVDADKILLVDKTDKKSRENWIEQWKYAGNYLDRKEALNAFSKNKIKQLIEGLDDKFSGLRLYTLELYEEKKELITDESIIKFEKLADSDPSKKVKAKAIELLTSLKDKKYITLFTKSADDSSYSVSGAALAGLVMLDPANAYALAKKYSNDARGKLGTMVSQIFMIRGTEEDFELIANYYKREPSSDDKILMSTLFANYLTRVSDANKVRAAVDMIFTYRNTIPEGDKSYLDPVFKNAFSKLSKAKREEGNKELADYISGLMK
ncbi:MAG: family metallopeptidase [Chitinophagaceae bacterium]|nr:family metallopeptidase [Chitinophagaceae bacterium]